MRTFQTTSIGAAFDADQSLRRRCRCKYPHDHRPTDAGAVIGDAGEMKHRPGSFLPASFFSLGAIGQVHFSNVIEMSLWFEVCHDVNTFTELLPCYVVRNKCGHDIITLICVNSSLNYPILA